MTPTVWQVLTVTPLWQPVVLILAYKAAEQITKTAAGRFQRATPRLPRRYGR